MTIFLEANTGKRTQWQTCHLQLKLGGFGESIFCKPNRMWSHRKMSLKQTEKILKAKYGAYDGEVFLMK